MNGGEPLSTPAQSSSALLIARVASNARACSRRGSRPNKWPGSDDTAHIVLHTLHPSATESLFQLFHASSPAFRDPRPRMYLPFPLCRYFRKTIPRLYLVKFRRSKSVHTDAFKYYCINHDNCRQSFRKAFYNVEK